MPDPHATQDHGPERIGYAPDWVGPAALTIYIVLVLAYAYALDRWA